MNADGDELPEGWAWTTIGEIASPSKKKVEPGDCPSARYLSLEHVESETGQILDSGRASDVNSTKAVFCAGDVLYGKLRPYLNKVTIPDFDGICSTDILVFPKTDWLLSVYLRHFLSTRDVVQYANHHSSGVQLPRVSFTKLGELPLPLPPLAEQKRIVAKVETLLARVNAARQRLAKVPALLKRFRQSVLAAACSGQLTEEWRVNDHGDQEKACDGAPASWPEVNFEEICLDITVGHVGPMASEYIESGIPFLRSQNVRELRFDPLGLKFIGQDFHRKLKKSALKPGDVAIVRSGNAGVAWVIPESLPEANCADLVIVHPGERLNPHFAAFFLNSQKTKAHVEAEKVGIAQGHFNIGSMRTTPIALPPLAEQHEIVRRVEALLARADRIEKRLAAATRRVETLTQAILAQAFRGELVPTEAELARCEGRDYEPASVLLERIRSERAQPSQRKPPRRARKAQRS